MNSSRNNMNIIMTLIVLLIGGLLAAWLIFSPSSTLDHAALDAHAAQQEIIKGPHRGRLLQQKKFAVEITIFEQGVPSEFQVYSYYDGKALSPGDVSLVIKLNRLDGQIDTFLFQPRDDYLRGDGVVTEPHSFDVTVSASYLGEHYEWHYENHEGRVQIASDIAAKSGIKTQIAGPRSIRETLALTGWVQTDPNRLSQVRARFPGVVKKVQQELGEHVRRGAVLATIQSNESLQDYLLKAPISGVIVQRDIQVGEATSTEALFTIIDGSKVWIELDVFTKDLTRVKTGQAVRVETLSGQTVTGKIDWLSPMVAHASQSIQARVVLANPDNTFKPGQFVRGRVTVAEYVVPLAVRRSGIQGFRDFQVVFARFDDTYEVRMLELGRGDHDWIEVLAGLKAGTEYVTENSYLIKADIEKSGASHDH